MRVRDTLLLSVWLSLVGCEKSRSLSGLEPSRMIMPEGSAAAAESPEVSVPVPMPAAPIAVPAPALPYPSDEIIEALVKAGARITRSEAGTYTVDVRGKPQFTDESIDLVLACPNVVDLTMERVAVTDAGLVKLRPMPLQRLILNGNPISGQGIKTLSDLPLRDSLYSIGLNSAQLTDDDIVLFANFQRLQRLDVSGTAITDACEESLAAMPLSMLNVTGTRLSPVVVDRLRERMPQTQVKH